MVLFGLEPIELDLAINIIGVTCSMILCGFQAGYSDPSYAQTHPGPMDRDDKKASQEQVSGFYGPGTYIAWLLSMLSGAIASPQGKRPSMEILSASMYAAISAMDVMIRGRNDDFQARAAFHIVYVASCCSLVLVLVTLAKVWASFLHCTLVTLLSYMLVDIYVQLWRLSMGLSLFCWIIGIGYLLLIGLLHLDHGFSHVIFLSLFTHAIVAFRGHRPSSFFPATSSKLSDLDQAATLATAVIMIIYQWKFRGLKNGLLRGIRSYMVSANPTSAPTSSRVLS
ncbi:hypothetical protein CPB86DRAFT_787506 [Serendipita vermifera]|nr:hypothetical protein CPB86DRAFT_787506 [Serendipita vermifera]